MRGLGPGRRGAVRLLAAHGWLAAVAALVWAGAATAGPGDAGLGQVVRVTDGDSLWWKPEAGGRALRVRLKGIDAPEICQAHGPQSRDALAALVNGRKVRLETVGQDDHGRWLGRLKSTEGVDLAARLVWQGQAWSYRYKGDPGPYAAEEAQAVAARRGLHRAPGAMQPRNFRLQHGPCS
jgi:micrococcal nuclease